MANWPALPEHDWDTHPTPGSITEDFDVFGDTPDTQTVRVLQGSRHPVHLPKITKEDDGARLNSPDAHRRRAVEELTSHLYNAEMSLAAARGWMASIGYHTDTRQALAQTVDLLHHVQDLMDIHEGQK